MNRTIIFNKEAREKIQKGVNTIADAVAVTLGANGRNVLISESIVVDYGTRSLPVKVTKDGVTVARNVHLTDQIENIGAIMMREASENTMQLAGDGTTTSIVLAREIVNTGMSLIDEGVNPMELKIGLDKAVEHVVYEINRLAIPVNNDVEKIRQIATVSANNDPSIGDLVAHAFEKIGKDGIINIEESKGVNTEVKVLDGFEIKSGYISPFFITDKSKNECVLIEPNILLFEKEIINMQKLVNVLQESIKTGRPLLIICEDSSGDALATVIMNTIEKRIPPVCIVKCPVFTDNKLEVMEDIAVCTGATYLTDSKGVGLERATAEHLGRAKKVVVTKDSTIIIGGDKSDPDYTNVLNDLRMNLTQAKGEEEKNKIERRIARLIGGIAVIYVGGPTETEMKERVDRVDDAVRAAKSANEEGYVPGAGTVFLGIASNITSSMMNENKLGWSILINALASPLTQICENAGVDPEEIKKWIQDNMFGFGFNAKTGDIVNLLDAGIIDPVKVLRCCLQNAASVAGMILTSECVIADTLN